MNAYLTLWAVPVASWAVGLLSALYLDRRRERRRLRGVAKLLQTEVARVRSGLGDKKKDVAVVPSFYGLTNEIPQIHPWVHKAIQESVLIDPGVVDSFMRLEMSLGNARHYREVYMEAVRLAEAMARLAITGPEELSGNISPQGQFAHDWYVEEHNAAVDILVGLRRTCGGISCRGRGQSGGGYSRGLGTRTLVAGDWRRS